MIKFSSWDVGNNCHQSVRSLWYDSWLTLHKKWSFPLRISSVHEDLVTFTKEILNGKLHFVCSVSLLFVFLGCFIYAFWVTCETFSIDASYSKSVIYLESKFSYLKLSIVTLINFLFYKVGSSCNVLQLRLSHIVVGSLCQMYCSIPIITTAPLLPVLLLRCLFCKLPYCFLFPFG